MFLVPDKLVLSLARADIESGDPERLYTYFRLLKNQLARMYNDISVAFEATEQKLDVIMDVDNEFLEPPRESASAQPTPSVGELKVWRDPDDNKTYLIYNDTDEGVRKVEMT